MRPGDPGGDRRGISPQRGSPPADAAAADNGLSLAEAYEAARRAYHVHPTPTLDAEVVKCRLAAETVCAYVALVGHVERFGPVAAGGGRYHVEGGELRFRRTIPVPGWRAYVPPSPSPSLSPTPEEPRE